MVKYYLIYQDSSIDEGSQTIIVGPFNTSDDREAVKCSHRVNAGGCWSVGIFDWEYVGEINGEVKDFEVSSPFELLNRYTPRDKGESETIRLYEHMKWLCCMGFQLPHEGWVRND